MNDSVSGWRRRMDSPYTQAWPARRISARRSNDCAGTISRPAIAVDRLSLTSQGSIRYALKSPYRDGTPHVVFKLLDFMARLVALIPIPQVNLTRYHGVFALNWSASTISSAGDFYSCRS